ncbi:serine--tRNA ligase [Rhizorhapis suberifaciens]|uniref:Serine--tRNA ligase n=1 Tax=Rhizorhapis suberifaciens TaxID=13656 RepID=A0A840HTI6_9SPHN|nr:serine--tRNA ligase [Rhizorhapis suberifaciens]MBB4641243.1 seryl-tRNA synthetase [Rhizorhapis suberifaciens]
MHDIRLIRENPDAFDAGLAKRGLGPLAGQLLALDEKKRAISTQVQTCQARRNEASKLIGQAMAQKDMAKAEALKAEVAELKDRMPELEARDRAVSEELHATLLAIPNLPADDVPAGVDENDNVEQTRWGKPREFGFTPQDHADFGPALGLDFEAAAAMSGARFAALRGQMARLHRALAQFMLDRQSCENGYEEVNPPLLVRDETLIGTGQLPKFADDLFRTTDGRWLIPTAEVSLTNLVREQILPETSLPLRFTALTPCFRSEAGSAGRDTRGFIRQHQFEKVELVAICRPEDSEAEHQKMVAAAEGILQALNLPYRRVLLCTGDMGFGARKTYDLEVWLPSQQTYREISSISNCGDFQARRMNARYKPEGEKNTRFLHTLNGSGLAVGRTLVAVLENYQQADGSVAIPEILAPYVGGIEKLTPR